MILIQESINLYVSGSANMKKINKAQKGISLKKIPEADPKNAVKDVPEYGRPRTLPGIKVTPKKVTVDKEPTAKNGNMIKRADGSYSKRGLWDNIRANKGSGKKPTAAMLKQEKKIKAQTKKK